MGASMVTIELMGSPEDAPEKLGALPGAAKVLDVLDTRAGNRTVHIETTPGADIRESIFRLAVKSGWVILEMRTEETKLEDIFRQLTT